MSTECTGKPIDFQGHGRRVSIRSNNGITAEIQNAKQNIRREFLGNARVLGRSWCRSDSG